MSLTIGFSTALSGIGLASRGTQVVADNIANAQTDGYGVRILTQAARVLGGNGSGVAATGVHRNVDTVLLADVRTASAQKTGDDIRTEFYARMESGFGMPDEPASLSALIDALDVSLLRAAADPSSTSRLIGVAQASGEVVTKLNSLDSILQSQRDASDLAISRAVASLNANLDRIADLNQKIQRQSLTGGTPQALQDERQRLVDQVSEMIAVREIAREDGRIMLLGLDGTVLVDRRSEPFSFTRTPVPNSDATIGNGGLAPIMLAGRSLTSGSALLASGSIGALLELRDGAIPAVQQDIDILARDLVSRFAQPDLDPSLPADAFGLFALEGAPSISAEHPGTAGRLILNPELAPPIGENVWHLQHGFGLTTQPSGRENDNALLDRLRKALREPLPLPNGAGVNRSVAGHVAESVSQLATMRLDLESKSAGSTASLFALSEAFAARGVDTDAELSRLLVLEQAYAANARVLSSVDAMWRSILEI